MEIFVQLKDYEDNGSRNAYETGRKYGFSDKTKSLALLTRQKTNIPIKVGLTTKAIPLHFVRSAEILPSHAL
jgi:hypothetical protein